YQHGKGHIRFRMRGFEMPYVALLVDGIPISDVYEANVDISKIPVMNASEIVINRGTCSALYGTTGTIGSINIITKKPLDLYAKGSAEYGTNGDYTLNAAHGNTVGGFYYWLTTTADKQSPYDVSKKLTRSTRREWFDKFMPTDAGYTANTTAASASTYLNDTGEWPHQEMMKYNLSGKVGYEFSPTAEAGITANYAKSKSQRYSTSLANVEDYTQGKWNNTSSTTLNGSAFNWRDVYSVTVSPYVQYKGDAASIKGNVFYLYNYEYLDGYQDTDETVPVKGWGGAHSNWQNSSSGFNLFPSYKIANWNTLNSSILFRWDKHLERVQADKDFIGKGAAGGGADAAFALAGNSWFDTKLMTGEQISVAIEDDINFRKLIGFPADLSAGISYDAQKLDDYKSRSQTMAMGRITAYGDSMTKQYIAKEDSRIWGTRDSFNPVVGLTYEPLKDLLLLRGSASQKTKLPTMSQYSNVYANSDVGLKAEKSNNVNAGIQLFFLEHTLSFRVDYFFSRFKDKLATVYDPATPSVKYYTNIKGEDHQGVEAIIDAKVGGIGDIVDFDTNFSYTYLKVKNLDTGVADSTINKGKRLADIPEHQLTADLRANFVTKTAIDFFGTYTANAIKYSMKSNPGTTDSFSTGYYKEVKLHNPLMLNIRISQTLFEKYELFVMCKNIMDDYAADPFNPGPGRQFSFGAKAEL
ncbi:MAG TPA: TonB-dependent receptor plug domain-containing protein, partial [Spirochaetota bacterium]